MKEQIKSARQEVLAALLEKIGLTHILVLNPSMGNLDQWLLSQGGLPTPAPFNRNGAYIASEDGVICLTQTTTHPTDRAQFPKFDEVALSDVFSAPEVGVVHPQFLKKNVRDYLCATYPSCVLRDVTEEFYAAKAVKTQPELESLGEAAHQYDLLLTTASLVLRPERLEKEVVNEIRQRLAWQGSDSETPGFHTEVLLTSAPDGAPAVQEPIRWPGRRLQYGDRVNVTIHGYQASGFAASIGRSFVLGSASQEAKDFWALAVEAQALAASLAKPGTTLRQITQAVNDFLTQRGVPADETGWIHGIGTSTYEAPRNVDATADMPLSENMVLSIGPAVKPQGKDAYACTDMFQVTAQGAVRLSKTPQTLREI
jgi:Xaa-Pro aminopeptidase